MQYHTILKRWSDGGGGGGYVEQRISKINRSVVIYSYRRVNTFP